VARPDSSRRIVEWQDQCHQAPASGQPCATKSRSRSVGAINAYAARLAERSDSRRSTFPAAVLPPVRWRSRPRHHHHGRCPDRCAAHHRYHRPAGARGHRHWMGQRLQHRARHKVHDQAWCRGGAYRGPGPGQALRTPAGKAIVSREEMVDRIKAAVDARPTLTSSLWRGPMLLPSRA